MHFPGQQQAKYTKKYLSLAISEKELIRRRNAWLEFISHPIPTERRFTTTLLLIFLKKIISSQLI
ncbi:hypothetical protein Peur_000746 [Populus x canadensis]